MLPLGCRAHWSKKDPWGAEEMSGQSFCFFFGGAHGQIRRIHAVAFIALGGGRSETDFSLLLSELCWSLRVQSFRPMMALASGL